MYLKKYHFVNVLIGGGHGYHKDGKKTIKLNTDGYRTLTSKKWINKGFDIFGVKKQLFQKDYKQYIGDYKWYISDDKRENIIDYNDNMIITIQSNLTTGHLRPVKLIRL